MYAFLALLKRARLETERSAGFLRRSMHKRPYSLHILPGTRFRPCGLSLLISVSSRATRRFVNGKRVARPFAPSHSVLLQAPIVFSKVAPDGERHPAQAGKACLASIWQKEQRYHSGNGSALTPLPAFRTFVTRHTFTPPMGRTCPFSKLFAIAANVFSRPPPMSVVFRRLVISKMPELSLPRPPDKRRAF